MASTSGQPPLSVRSALSQPLVGKAFVDLPFQHDTIQHLGHQRPPRSGGGGTGTLLMGLQPSMTT